MSTLVTGGTGFIGRYVIDRLQDDGECVVSYDRAPAAAGLPARTVSVQGELFDLTRLAGTIAGQDVRRIVHAAGMPDPQLSIGMPEATIAANALGTMNLLEAGRLTSFAGRIVLLSSTTVHGRPRTPYAAAKTFGDLLGQVYTDSYSLDVVSLRLTEAYGPGRRRPNLVEQLIEAGLRGRPLRFDSGADQPYHLVHVEDVARAVVAALNAPAPASRIYDIAGEQMPLGQVAAIVRDRLPRADIEIGPGLLADIDHHGPADSGPADRELGYRPRWSLARGIDDLCIWLEAAEAC
jgi:UDP-glucose 4-epimerase